MTGLSIKSLDQLVPLLENDVATVGDWSVYAHVRISRWDFWRPWFDSPDPVVEVSVDPEREKVRVYLGGEFSPERAAEPPFNYSQFVDALRTAAAEDPTLPLMAAGVFHMKSEEGEDYEVVMNLPVRTLTASANKRRKRITFTFHCPRRA